ncbi:MAG TPA: ATP-binding protein [Kofleriaceae bacterium]
MRSSIRNRILLTFALVVVLTGSGILLWLERSLADDLVASLDARLTQQGYAVAQLMTAADRTGAPLPLLDAVTGSNITIIDANGIVESSALEPDTVGQPIGNASEVSRARKHFEGHTIRQLHPGGPREYLVAVPATRGRVVRLAVPVEDLIRTRTRMRNRLLFGAVVGLALALALAYILVRAITRPLQSMTVTAQRFAIGDYDATAPVDAGGELGVLARAMTGMAGEIKTRFGELTAQRDLLSVVFGRLVEGVVVVDAGGTIVLVNDAARPLVSDTDRLPTELATLVDRARAGEESDGEVQIVGRAVRASARPLRANSATAKGAVGAIVVLYDVTRLRVLEGVRRNFLSNVAHELRTPVTSISGYAETLISTTVAPETAREFLQTIHRNADRISTLVSDLLVLETLEARDAVVSERGVVPLAAVIEDAVRTTRGTRLGEDVVEIEVSVPPDIAVLGTREGLDHIVQNLVDNAVKYAGTRVRVSASVEGTRVRLKIADSGPGIPRGEEERVFERFYRLDAGRSSDRGGSGLGLAIAKSQVASMGGRIWVEDNAPGARFVIELDAAV